MCKRFIQKKILIFIKTSGCNIYDEKYMDATNIFKEFDWIRIIYMLDKYIIS